ncbi:MAG: MFS transporter [Chloroflexi bacterium]|nr:MFS transporter [Chloroflexota bacterium]
MLNKLFRQSDVPPQYRANFIHLYFDIGWFGLLSGSSVNFLNVYAARLGATAFQIGLLGSVGAVVSLFLAIPAGRWLEKRAVGKAVFWTAAIYRIGFALWIPLPWLFGAQDQIWALILIALMMGIPLTGVAVGFNALFASSVPQQYRAHVAGMRNVVLSIMFMFSSVLSGYLLNHLPFPTGYQVVFAIGFFGAVMSTVHLYFIRPLQADLPSAPAPDSISSAASSRRDWRSVLRLEIWKTDYRRSLLVLLGFHVTQYLAIPLFSIYMVHNLRLTDDHIGIGTALFYLAMLFGSMQLRHIVQRLGHKTVTAYGVMGMALYPILMALSSQVWHFYGYSLLGGFVWALVGGAYANYLLENIPDHDRPAHLAWYNMVLNASVLFGSLAGPAIADGIGIGAALIVFGVLRLFAGAAILKWG